MAAAAKRRERDSAPSFQPPRRSPGLHRSVPSPRAWCGASEGGAGEGGCAATPERRGAAAAAAARGNGGAWGAAACKSNRPAAGPDCSRPRRGEGVVPGRGGGSEPRAAPPSAARSASGGGHGVPAPALCPEARGQLRLASPRFPLGGGSPRPPPALPWRPAAPQPSGERSRGSGSRNPPRRPPPPQPPRTAPRSPAAQLAGLADPHRGQGDLLRSGPQPESPAGPGGIRAGPARRDAGLGPLPEIGCAVLPGSADVLEKINKRGLHGSDQTLAERGYLSANIRDSIAVSD